MSVQDIRTYEVSVWTLQDDFLTVLKQADADNKGQIQMPKMTLGIDGTRTYEFKIPIYIFENGQRIENPIWYTTTEGLFIENLRKIKVIFNKGTEYEHVFEFIITKVTDEHTNDELYCNVTCEGLAFNELGKIGYKISLSTEDFYNKYDDWFYKREGAPDSEPIATIDYWLRQFLKPLDSATANPSEWYYSIEMDWGSYNISENRQSNKIYDDAYVGNWTTSNGKLTANKIIRAQEKARLVDMEESNIYNLTQQLAETFGVFCRYEFEHDSTYHITKRKIIFYNHFFYENEGYLDLTYPYSTSSVKREIESADLVTKMFVKPIDSVESESNLITIMNVPANKSKEDYLLDFDYLHDIETISEEQYAAIEPYEAQMRDFNTQIIALEQQKIDLEEKITPVKAQKTLSENAVALDQERISSANDLLNSILQKTADSQGQENSDTIHITKEAPDTAILIEDKAAGSYYIRMTKQGVDKESIHVYREYELKQVNENLSKTEKQAYKKVFPPESELKTKVVETDEFGEVVKISNLYKKAASDSNIVYLTYNYTPKLYYQRVINTWTNRLAKDQGDLTYATSKLSDLEREYKHVVSDYNTLLSQKREAIAAFERLMGPAIREGYWQPENFTDYGDHYQDTWPNIQSGSNSEIAGTYDTQKEMDYFLWDSEPFYDEQLAYYYVGVNMDQCQYPCILLPDNILTSDMEENARRLKCLSYSFFDYNASASTGGESSPTTEDIDGRRRIFMLGSQCQLGFVVDNRDHLVKPALILTGIETLSSAQTTGNFPMYKNGAVVGSLEVELDATTQTMVPKLENWSYPTKTNPGTLTFLTNPTLVYPRIVVKSLAMKKDSKQLSVGYNMTSLEQYKDFYITSRRNENTLEPYYYITLKPEALLRRGGLNKSLSISYIISNADISIYLDAVKILKENAYPKVSYQIDVNLVDETVIRQAYDMLSHLVHINDNDLKFKNVRGYISKVTLDLDKPWEDKYEIKNYRNKFEDLFSSIIAQTAAMKSSSGLIDLVANSFTLNGELDPTKFQNSLRKIDLNYAFNHGKLTIDEENGIWGTSEAGVVAFRGGGIFTSTKKDNAGNWIWNTGIVPQGINADLITAGQLDTNRVMVYAGDKLRFQLNGDGLFAYKSFFEDLTSLDTRLLEPDMVTNVNKRLEQGLDVDSRQFIKMDANGLFFIVKKGALVLNSEKTNYITIDEHKKDAFGYTDKISITSNGRQVQIYNEQGIPYHSTDGLTPTSAVWVYNDKKELIKYKRGDQETLNYTLGNYGDITDFPADGIQRVSITWDGLTLRNYNNEEVFYADPNSGNLYIKGSIFADAFYIVKEQDGEWVSTLFDEYLRQFYGEDNVNVKETLQEAFDQAGEILQAGLTSISELEEINYNNQHLLYNFLEDMKSGLKADREIKLYGTSSVDIYNGDPDDISTVNVISLNAERGIWLGSGKAINFYSGGLNNATSSSSSVSINPQRILFGVIGTNASASATALEMNQDAIILASAGNLTTIQNAQFPATGSSSPTAPYETLKSNTQVTAMVLEKDRFGLATQATNNSRNLILMDEDGVFVGNSTALDSNGDLDLTGAFVNLSSDGTLRIGAAGNIYMHANNMALDNAGHQESRIVGGEEQVEYPDSNHKNTYFRLGPDNYPGLLFDGTNLWIRGNISAANIDARNTNIVKGPGNVIPLASYILSFLDGAEAVEADLSAAFAEAAEILTAANNSLTALAALDKQQDDRLYDFYTEISTNYMPAITSGDSHPVHFKEGDIWIKTTVVDGTTIEEKYVAILNWDEVYTGNTAEEDAEAGAFTTAGWNKLYDGSLANIAGADMDIDAEAGTINLKGRSSITLESNANINLTGNGGINLSGNGYITLTSGSGIKLITILNADDNDDTNDVIVNKFKLDYNGVEIGSNGSNGGIKILSGNDYSVNAIQLNGNGIALSSNQPIILHSGTIDALEDSASVKIAHDEILFGVSNTEVNSITASATSVAMTSNCIVMAAGSDISTLESNNGNITLTNTLTGLKMTKDSFGIATQVLKSNSNNENNNDPVYTRNVLLMNSEGVTVASGDAGDDLNYSGSIIKITPTELRIGSLADLNINTDNMKLTSRHSGADITTFGLGTNLNGGLSGHETPNYSLLFQNGTLYLHNIVARGLIFAENTTTKLYNLNTSKPAKPDITSYPYGVTSTSDSVMLWTTVVPVLPTQNPQNYHYYTCNQIEWLDGSDEITWSDVIEDVALMDNVINFAEQGNAISNLNTHAGNKWYVGNEDPAHSGLTDLVMSGDMYLDTSVGEVWVCTANGQLNLTSWTQELSLTTSAGNRWYTGIVPPTDSTLDSTIHCNVGDMYLDSETGNIYQCTQAGYLGSLGDHDAVWSVPQASIKGPKGDTGISINSVVEYYQATDDPTTSPSTDNYSAVGSLWETAIGLTNSTVDNIKKYLWNFEVIMGIAADGTQEPITTTNPVIIYTYTKDGESISRVEEWYLATDLSHDVTTSTLGWSTGIQTTDRQKPYLWNYEKIWGTGSDVTPLNTTDPIIIGVYGEIGNKWRQGGTPIEDLNTGEWYNVGDMYLYTRDNSVYTCTTAGFALTEAAAAATQKTRAILSKIIDTLNGEAIGDVQEYYSTNNDPDNAPTIPNDFPEHKGDWKTRIADALANGHQLSKTNRYLWNFEYITGTTGKKFSQTSPAIMTTYVEDGRSINNIIEYYKTSTSLDGKPDRDDNTWDYEQIPEMTEQNRFLWNYEKIVYSSGDPSYTDVMLIGAYGRQGPAGTSVHDVVEYYQKSEDFQNAPSISENFPNGQDDDKWSTSVVATDAEKKYLWNFERILDENGDEITKTSPVIINTYVQDGRSIGTVQEYYQCTDSYQNAPTKPTSYDPLNNGWYGSAQVPTIDKPYLWNFERILDTSGDQITTTNPAVIGMYGEAGSKWHTGSGVPEDQTSGVWCNIGDIYLNTSDGQVSACETAGYLSQNLLPKAVWSPSLIIKGSSGESIDRVQEYYKLNNDEENAPTIPDDFPTHTNDWKPTIEGNDGSGYPNANSKFLWNFEVIIGSNGSKLGQTAPSILSKYVTDGRSVTITEHYKTTPNNTIPKISDDDWQDSDNIPMLSATNKFLWNYETITYTNPSETKNSAVALIGVYGQDGFSPTASVYRDGNKMYLSVTNQSGTTSKYVEDGISPTASVTKSNGKTTITITDASGAHTQDVLDGESPTLTVSKSGNTVTIKAKDKNGTTTQTVSDGANGSPGRSISSVTQIFRLDTAQSGIDSVVLDTHGLYYDDRKSKWTTVVPTYSSGYYYWRAEQIVYTTGTSTVTEYSTPYRDYGLQAVQSSSSSASSTTVDNIIKNLKANFGAGKIDYGANNISSGYGAPWGTNYEIAVTGNKKVLIAAGGELTLGSGNSATTFTGISMTQGSFTLRGANIKLNAQDDNKNWYNAITLDKDGISLNSDSSISLSSGFLSLDSGSISMFGGSISLSGGSIKLDSSGGNHIYLTTSGIDMQGGSLVFTAGTQMLFKKGTTTVFSIGGSTGAATCTKLTVDELIVTGTFSGNLTASQVSGGVAFTGSITSNASNNLFSSTLTNVDSNAIVSLKSNVQYNVTVNATIKEASNDTSTGREFLLAVWYNGSEIGRGSYSHLVNNTTATISANFNYTPSSNLTAANLSSNMKYLLYYRNPTSTGGGTPITSRSFFQSVRVIFTPVT